MRCLGVDLPASTVVGHLFYDAYSLCHRYSLLYDKYSLCHRYSLLYDEYSLCHRYSLFIIAFSLGFYILLHRDDDDDTIDKAGGDSISKSFFRKMIFLYFNASVSRFSLI